MLIQDFETSSRFGGGISGHEIVFSVCSAQQFSKSSIKWTHLES